MWSKINFFLRDERGFSTPELLVITAVGASIAVGVVRILLPTVVSAHTTVTNRITKVTGSGF